MERTVAAYRDLFCEWLSSPSMERLQKCGEVGGGAHFCSGVLGKDESMNKYGAKLFGSFWLQKERRERGICEK